MKICFSACQFNLVTADKSYIRLYRYNASAVEFSSFFAIVKYVN